MAELQNYSPEIYCSIRVRVESAKNVLGELGRVACVFCRHHYCNYFDCRGGGGGLFDSQHNGG